ncbi:cdc-25.1 [Pristionchus pacificus]|uniref:Cdc-25.1 n=1 Tax=Pristionchus pacificus TaxID=54126 RepID=A0A454XZ89_PRIPA|nr:cdc-25.1 [Pristionchus pacificus]|eukprot:PDM77116.1 cdc-25.1 [Pristionchus pacificus]
MASDERSEVATALKEGECTPRMNGEAPKTTQESGSRLGGLKDLTNFSVGLSGVRKRSTGAQLGQRAKPSQLKSNLRDFFYESRVSSPSRGRKDSGTLELIETAKEEGIDDWSVEAGGSKDEVVEKKDESYTRLFTGQNEHHSNRTFRRTQSQYEEVVHSRKRGSIDGEEKHWDEAPDRKRSCAIVLADDSTVNVDPEDDDVFEASSPTMNHHPSLLHTSTSHLQLEKEGSPMSEYGLGYHAVMHHRANFERTLSASVLERGEFAPPLRDHPNLPALPNIVYDLPLVSTKDAKVHSVAFGCISAHTLAAEMHKLGLDEFHRKYVLIDCRYPYEYEGGHIKNAINLHDNSDLPALFFPPESILDDIDASSNDSEKTTSSSIVPSKKEKTPVPPPHRRIPVFYCEYSQKRGPTMAHDLRSIDRRRNIDRYPDINYDVMYLLECGYRNFFNTFNESNCELFSSHCAYVEMKQEKKELGKFKAHRKRGRARQVQLTEATSEMSPTTPGVPANKEGRRASMVAREKIRETLGSRLGPKIRLAFDSEDEKSPMKKKEGLKPLDL